MLLAVLVAAGCAGSPAGPSTDASLFLPGTYAISVTVLRPIPNVMIGRCPFATFSSLVPVPLVLPLP